MHLALSIGALIAFVVAVAGWVNLLAGYWDPPPPTDVYLVPLMALLASLVFGIAATVVA